MLGPSWTTPVSRWPRSRETLAWHAHVAEDALFFILKGCLRIDMENSSVLLGEGDACVVREGVRHNPVADEECLVVLIKRKKTLHTGNASVSYTAA